MPGTSQNAIKFNVLKPLESPRTAVPFPLDCLPPPIADYCEAVAENITVSRDMPAALSLAVMSAALQGKAKVRYKASYTEEINVYICIVAEPAERKSPVFRAITKPLNLYVSRYNSEKAEKISNYLYKKKALECKLARAVSRGKADEIEAINAEIVALEPFYPMRVLITDTTVEALADALSQNKERASIITDEGGIFDIAAGQYSDGSVNIDLYLKGYDGSTVSVERKSGTTSLSRPLITFGVMAQEQILNQILSNAVFRGRGFVQRFLFCAPESLLGTARMSRSDVQDAAYKKKQNAYNSLIYKLMGLPLADENTFIEIDDAAASIFEAFYNSVETNLRKGGKFEDNKDFYGKYASRALRIAGLLHLASGEKTTKPINAATMNNAVKIVDYFCGQADLILGAAQRECKQAVKLFEKMKNLAEKSTFENRKITLHQIKQKSRNFSENELENALAELEEHGYILELPPTKPANGGRLSRNFLVNPAVGFEKEVKK